MTESSRTGGRDLRRNGYRIDVFVYGEVRDWLAQYFKARARARKARGIVEPPGEQKGPGMAMARVAAWLCSLSDADIERIQREGGAILAELDARPPDYGLVPGRADPIGIDRRIGSVFAPDADSGYVPPEGLRAVGTYGLSGPDRADVDEQAPVAKPRPRRR